MLNDKHLSLCFIELQVVGVHPGLDVVDCRLHSVDGCWDAVRSRCTTRKSDKELCVVSIKVVLQVVSGDDDK